MRILALLLGACASIVTGHVVCRNAEFRCDGNRCLPASWVCDGSPDCTDGSDEKPVNCPDRGLVALVRECRSNEFKCSNSNCIPSAWKCDGQDDCGDNSDESLQECAKCQVGEFQCIGNNHCISRSFTCNGIMDCDDGSDEANCERTQPPMLPHMFLCVNGRRIPKLWVCDGEDDCKDNSDETNCTSTTVAVNTTPAPLCLDNEYQCGMYCIMQSWVCDGKADCESGEDERGCPEECPPEYFKCANAGCIRERNVCDGNKNCEDGSDEQGCPTREPPVPDEDTCNTETHFLCHRNNNCIPKEKLCDGNDDCADGQDELVEGCVNECDDRNNGGCAHECIDTREGHYCRCRKGYRLIRGFDCEDIDECTEQPGACSQRCTNTVGSFHCSCLPGYRRDPRNFTRCKADAGEPYLLFSHSYDIRRLRLRDGELTSVVNNTRLATAIDYQYSSHQIVWCNNKESNIMRADMTNPEGAEVLVEGENLVADGLAVDWIHNNIYYTDTKRSEVRMISWDGQYTKTVVNEHLRQPRAIVANPIDGYLYWTDWGNPPKIERSGLDGSDRMAMVSSPVVHWPNSITVDYASKKLYWCDGFYNKIMKSELDGSHVETVLYSPSVLRHPFSVSVFEDRMYWVDWSKIALFSADKFTGNDVEHVSAGHLLESPRVVHVLHPYRQPSGKNVCNSASCSHFCVRSALATPVCVCPDGYMISTWNTSFCVVETVKVPPAVPVPEWERANEVPSAVMPVNALPGTDTQKSSDTPQAGMILGVILGASVVLAAIITVMVGYWRYRQVGTIKHSRFPNPVYRKTTDDDGGGYIIGQDQLLYSSPPDYQYSEDPENCLVEQDDVPLAPKK
ncbi:hypothetical protein Pcinc_023266 [Petrolisthes cinctipes]|uniref:EGF-like domain-containing protein n=1 Tax=Petrolisthes cinctipes TaxID=88211 RepID=A0AAE1KG02_PETCI|nr:hypothetical protein Pcinc_023266 [Petrolisthes cinctipes]